MFAWLHSTPSANIPCVRKRMGALVLVACVVFVFFFSIFVAMKMQYPGVLSTHADPYFHTRYAAELAAGATSPILPSVSTLSWWGGGTLYLIYHHSLARCIALFNASDDVTLLLVITKIYHAALSALVLVTYFVVTVRLLWRRVPSPSSRVSIGLSLLSIFLLLAIFGDFFVRLSFERAFLVAVLLTLVLIDAVLARAYIRIVAVGALLSLTYSFAVFSVLPVCIFSGVCVVLYGIRQWYYALLPLCLTLAGLLLGILLHPNPIHYVFNGSLVHALALLHSFAGGLPEASEIKTLVIERSDYLWIALTGIFPPFLWWIVKIQKQAKQELPLVFLSVLSVVLFVLTLMFQRTIEYYAPIAMLTMTGIVFYVWQMYAGVWKRAIRYLSRTKRLVFVVLVSCLFALQLMYTSTLIIHRPLQWHLDGYLNMFAVLESVAQDGDVVHIPIFSSYPLAYFYMPQYVYTQGNGLIFARTADKDTFYLMSHMLSQPDTICAQHTCNLGTHTAHQVLAEHLQARFVMVQYRVQGGSSLDYSVAAHVEFLSGSSQFTKVYDKTEGNYRYVLFEVRTM